MTMDKPSAPLVDPDHIVLAKMISDVRWQRPVKMCDRPDDCDKLARDIIEAGFRRESMAQQTGAEVTREQIAAVIGERRHRYSLYSDNDIADAIMALLTPRSPSVEQCRAGGFRCEVCGVSISAIQAISCDDCFDKERRVMHVQV